MRNAGSGPVPGQNSKGRFVKGNRLGKGRPWGIPRLTLHLTYRDALTRACSPQDLLEITRRAVVDAKKGDHYARMYIAKIMGLDSLRITVGPPDSPVPVYNLDALSDTELEVLGRLGSKMISGPDDT